MTKNGPELVIGLVGAAGCDFDLLVDTLRVALSDVGYTAYPIRVSHLLHSFAKYDELSDIVEYDTRVDRYMTAGDEFCGSTGPEAMALLAIAEIRNKRREQNAEIPEEERDSTPLRRSAYILNSLKRPSEVEVLRAVYGDAFVLVSAYASRENRSAALALKIARSRSATPQQWRGAAEKLIERDENETGLGAGQNVRDTFPLGDIFVDADDKSALEESAVRAVAILFAHPFITPTKAELGMQFAKTAALRSADLSRQVGYAALTEDGELVAVGTNEVAKAGGGLYWPGEGDARDFQISQREPNAELKLELLAGLLRTLQQIDPPVVPKDASLSTTDIEQIAEKIKQTSFWSITEYGRAVHAEMSLITHAARRGVSLQGTSIYGTTFPCHNCAKHIVAAGIDRVVYVEPYPKSQVARLYPDSISIEKRCDGKVLFEPFVGIAPHRFSDYFSMTDRKGEGAVVLKWEEKKKSAVPRTYADPAFYLPREVEQIQNLDTSIASGSIQFSKRTTEPESEVDK